MADNVRSLVGCDGRVLGSVIHPEVMAELRRLVGMILTDALGESTDFEENPARAVLVTYGWCPNLIWLFSIVIDPALHALKLHFPGEEPVLIEPLTEPRFRLARKVSGFLGAVKQRRASFELSLDGTRYRPRRLIPTEYPLHGRSIYYILEPVPVSTPSEPTGAGDSSGS